jgi:hypothetical protein
MSILSRKISRMLENVDLPKEALDKVSQALKRIFTGFKPKLGISITIIGMCMYAL